jgi:predicted nucleic acid-binding protein
VNQFGYLADTSALVRMNCDADVHAAWQPEINAGSLAVCPLIELEILLSARSAAHRQELRATVEKAYRLVAMPDRVFQRAESVHKRLAERGTDVSAGPADLLIAATAELHGLTLLHYDSDFLQVAEVTGQSVRWLAEPGSIA